MSQSDNHRTWNHIPAYILLFIFPAILVFSGCRSTETITVRDDAATVEAREADREEEDDEDAISFRIGELEPLKSLDPLFAKTGSALRATSMIYEGLVRFDKNGEIVPAIASEWEVSDDSLSWTFKLREDVFFHDDQAFPNGLGRQITSEDVVFVFNRMASKNVPDDAAKIFKPLIQGFDAFFQQERTVFFLDELLIQEIRGISADNDHSVTFHLNRPGKEILHALAHPMASIYPYEVIRARTTGLHNQPVGTGIFKYSHSDGDSVITLSRNFDYRDQSAAAKKVVNIVISVKSDESKLFQKLITHELDFIPEIGPKSSKTILTSDKELSAGYQDKLHLLPNGYTNFNLYYFPDNFAGTTLDQLDVESALLQDDDEFWDGFPANLKYEIHKVLDPASSLADSDTLHIGFDPNPFVSYTARTFAYESERENLRMYPVRRTNYDLSLAWLKHTPTDYPHELVGSFTFHNFGILSRRFEGVKLNEYRWWISLTDLKQVKEEPI